MSQKFVIRPYQHSAVDNTLAIKRSGKRSALIVAPTGCGKTVIIAELIRRLLPLKIMFLAHRKELIMQAKGAIEDIARCGVTVEMGDMRAEMEAGLFSVRADVVVSSVQTQVTGGDGGGRISKFNPQHFGVLFIDEAHHSVSPSYRKAIDYYMTNEEMFLIGVTATPDRGDEEALGQVFQEVAFDYEILDAIKDGWLVPVEQQMVSIEDLDFSSIRTQAGDLNNADLSAVMEKEKNLHGVASAAIDILDGRGKGKRGIGFAVSVAQAITLSDIFNRHRPGMSCVVHGKTDPIERDQMFKRFKRGEFQFLWNCGVATEGFDDPGIEIVVMARPTKSRALYAQMAGRPMRPDELIAHKLNYFQAAALRRMLIMRSRKPSCLIVDFVGNSGKHKLVNTADILGGNVSDEAIQLATQLAIRTGKPMRMDETLEEEERKKLERDARVEKERARKANLVGKAKFKVQAVDAFNIFDVKPNEPRGWDKGKSLSEAQREVLRKLKIDPDSVTYAQGRQLVEINVTRWRNKLCSMGQAKILKQHGFDVNVSFDRARQLLDALSANHWQRPRVIPAPGRPAAESGAAAPRQEPRTALGKMIINALAPSRNPALNSAAANTGVDFNDDVPF